MGVGEVANLSNSHHTQDVQDSVSGWLFSECREFYNLDKVQEHPWPHVQYKFKKDVDQSSVASVDDSVSLSDSTHESQSSESSAHTSWTSTTDPADIFLDEEEREQLHQSKCSHASRTSIELQEHLLKGLQTKDQTSCSSRFSSSTGDAYHNLKAHVSYHHRSEVFDRSQKAAQAPSSDAHSEARTQKCSNRRSACTSNQEQPPKLKRDTEITDQFVTLLIIFATRLITAIWPLSASPPMMSTSFNGAGVLPLRVFIQETLRRSKTSYSTLQVALYYLVLLKSKLPPGDFTQEQPRSQVDGDTSERPQCRAMQCGRRMFLSALMLASKYLQNRNYSARAWSKISGLRSNEINENEREYLLHIDFNLHVPKDSFDNWSKIVLTLSKLSKERPQCRPDSSNLDFGRPGSGTSNVLADMVSQVDLDQVTGEHVYSDEWWSQLIQRLDPAIVKNSVQTDDFIRKNLPADKIDHISSPNFNKPLNKPWEIPSAGSDPLSPGLDMNFSETLRPRNADQSKIQTPQTPVQMSPVRTSGMPMQPYLRNLPTPQSTPRFGEGCQWSGNYNRPSLRCSASMDALQSMRKQCIMNANLERCPPPRPQACGFPPVKSLMRPAETIQELPSRSTTPLTSSPASVTSDSTTCTSRSRSSSLSSNSSYSSWCSATPRSRFAAGAQFSSPLARISSLSDRYCRPTATEKGLCSKSATQRSDVSSTKFHDEGYGSGEEPRVRLPKYSLSSNSEVDAAQVLMTLSSQSESTSQSVTPTPQHYAGQESNDSPRGHKRTLSKTDYHLQSQVRSTLLDGGMSFNVVEDPLPPFYDITPKQWQMPTKSWACPRRALPNNMDNKRVAAYCSIQQFASAPDLASQYLKDSMMTVS